jgi:hypothetical protein
MNENPIDKDKITENPHNLEYAHHRGSALVKPEDTGKIKGLAISAMEHQTDMQLEQIRQQMALLADQVGKINRRKEISFSVYQAACRFEPLINHTYHLYEKDNGPTVLSMIGPNDWGRKSCPYQFLATVKLLADHTWDIIEEKRP